MRKFLSILIFSIASLSLCLAQTPTPTPTPTPVSDPNTGVHFVTDTALYQMADGKQATVFSARLPVTPKYSGVFSQWLVPTHGNISLAGIEYRTTLARLFKGKSTNLDLTKMEVFARGQLGSEQEADTNKRNFAYGLEGGLEFPVGTIGGGTIKTGVRFGFLGLPYNGEHTVLSSNLVISPQVSLSF